MCNVTHWPAATLSNAISCDFLKDFLLAIFGGKAKGKRNYITRSKGKWMKWMDLPKIGALRMAICDLKATASDIALGILCRGKGTWPSHPGCKAETNQEKK